MAGYRIANLVISIYEKTATEDERRKAKAMVLEEMRLEEELRLGELRRG